MPNPGFVIPNQTYPKGKDKKNTYRVKEAMRSEFVKLAPMLYLVRAPSLVSKDRSPPTASFSLPRAPEKLTMGLGVNPKLEVIPA